MIEDIQKPLIGFDWKILEGLIEELKTRDTTIADIKSITITKHERQFNGKKHNYWATILFEYAKKEGAPSGDPIIEGLNLEHLQECTWHERG
jgi:hypothetical protein